MKTDYVGINKEGRIQGFQLLTKKCQLKINLNKWKQPIKKRKTISFPFLFNFQLYQTHPLLSHSMGSCTYETTVTQTSNFYDFITAYVDKTLQDVWHIRWFVTFDLHTTFTKTKTRQTTSLIYSFFRVFRSLPGISI